MSYKKLNRLFIILVICNFVLMPLHILGAKYIRNSSSQSDMVVTNVEKDVHIDVSASIKSDCVTTLETETTIETEYVVVTLMQCTCFSTMINIATLNLCGLKTNYIYP